MGIQRTWVSIQPTSLVLFPVRRNEGYVSHTDVLLREINFPCHGQST